MPAENLDVVRRVYETWRERGFGVVPELMHPDISYVNPPDAIEPGTRRGYDGFAEAARAFSNIYEDSTVTLVEVSEFGSRIAVRGRIATRSRGNAVPIETERGYVFEVRDGRLTLFAWFNDPSEAVAFAQESDQA